MTRKCVRRNQGKTEAIQVVLVILLVLVVVVVVVEGAIGSSLVFILVTVMM